MALHSFDSERESLCAVHRVPYASKMRAVASNMRGAPHSARTWVRVAGRCDSLPRCSQATR